MATEIHKEVIHIIGSVRSLNSEITPHTSINELDLDEYDYLELIMRLEDQFKVCIDDAQFKKIESVEKLTQYIISFNK